MSELNEFFEQILHTERSLSSRNVKLRKLKEEIHLCVLALQQVREEVKTRQGELAVRNVKMVDQEVEARLLDLRKIILEEQNGKLAATNRIMTSELETATMQLESDSEQFLEELIEFGKSYDLIGAGYKHREEQIQRRVGTLQDEVLLLEAELTEFDSEREEVEKLEQKLAEAEDILRQKREDKKALENQVLDDEAEAKQLEEVSSSKLSTDPEIVKLQKELEECRDCPEEKTYHSLHRELEELQRLCYHKQMKQHMPQRKKRDSQSERDSGKGGGTAYRRRSRMSCDHPRQTGHYNPYTYQYVPSAGAYKASSGAEHDDGGDSEEREEESGGQGSSAVIGEEGDAIDGEGWDDELEAMELASFQESLSVAEMEWVEDEGEGEEGGIGDSGGGWGKVREREGGRVFERRQQLDRRVQEHKQSLSQALDASRIRRAGRSKDSFIKQQSTPKAVRTVVKRGGDQAVDSTHLSSLTDSPMPGEMAPKKSSGQSIYKAPGQHEPMEGVPKTAKRVRFRY